MTRWPFAIVAGMLLAACTSVPSRPSIAALPGSAKNADEFRADDAACRQAAAIEAKATEKWRDDMTYLQCMYSSGNQIPMSGRSAPAVPPSDVPPPPAGTPPPPPSGPSR